MATSRRRKTPARWLMAGLSGLAAAGFLGAILSGPHPTDATPAAASSQAPAVTAGETDSGVAGVSPAFSAPAPAPASGETVVAAPPRFRTRGS